MTRFVLYLTSDGCCLADPALRVDTTQAVSETLDAHSRQAVKRVSEQCTAGRMQKTFRSLDSTGTGVLTKRQFKHALDLMGLHEDRDDYTTIWRLADARGTGHVNYVRHATRARPLPTRFQS